MSTSAFVSSERTRRSSDLAYWDGLSEQSLRAAMSPPVLHCIEYDLVDQIADITLNKRTSGQLGLVVTTRSAYRHFVARAFVEAMASRIPLLDDLRERAHTAVHEALMNAVLHGNLGISSADRESLSALMETEMRIEALLTLPRLALSVVRIEAIWNSTTLHVRISDSGDGFQRPESGSLRDRPANENAASGRGLSIMAAICDRVVLLDGGRSIKLGFRL